MADALHTPGVVTAAEARLDDAGLIAVQGPTALDARTGVLVGPGTTTLVTGTAATAPMQYAIAPHHWVTSRGVNTDGVYRGTNEAVQLVNTTAAPGSGSRIDVIYEKQGDATSTITPDGATAPVYGVVQGTSTTGTPTKPAIPVGALELGTATVAAGATATNGSGVVITNTARQTTTRGGIVPVRTQAERVALQTGGLVYPTLQVLELDKGRLLWHDGTKFRYDGDSVTVTSSADRDALTAYEGLTAYRSDTHQLERYNGTTWARVGDITLGAGALASANGTTVAGTPGWTDLATVTATSSGGPVTVTASATIFNGASGADRTGSLQVICDSTVLGSLVNISLNLANLPRIYKAFAISHTPAAGSHVWKIQGQGSASAAVVVDGAQITVTEQR